MEARAETHAVDTRAVPVALAEVHASAAGAAGVAQVSAKRIVGRSHSSHSHSVSTPQKRPAQSEWHSQGCRSPPHGPHMSQKTAEYV